MKKPYRMYPSLAFFEIVEGHTLAEAQAVYMRKMAAETSFTKVHGISVWIYCTADSAIFGRYISKNAPDKDLLNALGMTFYSREPFYRGCHLKVIK